MPWPLAVFPTRAVNVPRSGGTLTNVTLTAGTPAHTKGAWATLVSSVGGSVGGAWVIISPGTSRVAAALSGVLLDLAVGSAGNETIIVSNLFTGYWSRDQGLVFPIHLPAGATLRGRIQAVTAAKTQTFCVDVVSLDPVDGSSIPGKITTYGANTATSGGVQITPGAVAGVKGTYAELTASTTAPIHAIMLLGQGTTATQTSAEYDVDIAVGAALSETIVVPDWAIRNSSSETVFAYNPFYLPITFSIPSGTRLSARCAADGAAVQALEIALYGFTF